MGSIKSEEEVVTEILPLLHVYKDGHVEGLMGSEIDPPSPHDPETGVSSKDIIISTTPNVSARLYLPNLRNLHDHKKLPVLVYFHGGGFCIASAFSSQTHRYLNIIVSLAKVIAVSVEYRLAPEHPIPAAYDDSWDTLQWVIANAKGENMGDSEEWLREHADVNWLFLGGDSAGGNIVHNVAIRAGVHGLEHDINIKGAFLGHPYFLGSTPIGLEPSMPLYQKVLVERIWLFVSPSSNAGLDDPWINPVAPDAPSLAKLGCERMLVCVAGKDVSVERGRMYCKEVRKSGWGGVVELFESEDERHAFHIFNPDCENFQAFGFISHPLVKYLYFYAIAPSLIHCYTFQ